MPPTIRLLFSMRNLLWLLLALPLFSSAADKLVPLSEPVARIATRMSGPKMDWSEFAYVSIRSSCLLGNVAAYVEQGSKDENVLRGVKTLNDRSQICLHVALMLRDRTGQSVESIMGQIKVLDLYYSAEIKTGKALNNNAFTELIQSDLQAANEVFPMIDELNSVFEERAKQATQNSNSSPSGAGGRAE